jgi:hypothetical protein
MYYIKVKALTFAILDFRFREIIMTSEAGDLEDMHYKYIV